MNVEARMMALSPVQSLGGFEPGTEAHKNIYPAAHAGEVQGSPAAVVP